MIYLHRLEGQNLIKIGYTENPKKRISQLQVGMPHKILPFAERNGSVALEAKIHRKLSRFCVTGEWYQDAQEVYDAFFEEMDPYPSCYTRKKLYEVQLRERKAEQLFVSENYLITKAGQVRRKNGRSL